MANLATFVPSPSLIKVLSQLDGEQGVEILSEWKPYTREVFAMEFAIVVENGSEYIPRRTRWFAVATNEYPDGPVRILPAKVGGIRQTFQHQRLNVDDEPRMPWLDGEPCLNDWDRGVAGGKTDRDYGELRLGFLVVRLIEWVHRAAANDLTRVGDPFELPQYAGVQTPVLVYAESRESFQSWLGHTKRDGLAMVGTNGECSSVLHFDADGQLERIDLHGRCAAGRLSPWGIELSEAPHVQKAPWVLLDEVLVLSPWQPPTTWGQLRILLGERWSVLHERLRRHGADLLLIGMPIPEFVGGKAVQIHWQAAKVPALFQRRQLSGFRQTNANLSAADLRGPLADSAPLHWVRSENWSESQLSRRYGDARQTPPQDVLLVGCGALGSMLAELLVRSGTRRIWLCDGDRVEGGNLVRSVYTIDDVGTMKAAALAKRLGSAYPYASPIPLTKAYNLAKLRIPMEQVRWIFECSGEPYVLKEVAGSGFAPDAMIVSLSLSWEAAALLVACGKAETFDANTTLDELDTLHDSKPKDIHAEGIGCYHPAFPAEPHRVALHVAMAIERLARWRIGRDELTVEAFDLETLKWTGRKN